jgi:TRAP-type C4-dicarboxylate transport system permease small subunit
LDDFDPHAGSGPRYADLAGGSAFDRLCWAVLSLTRPVAVAGGLILVGMTALIVVAIVARALRAPILGDIEIVELFSGIAIFAMFPFCQMARGNIQVRIFLDRLPRRTRSALELLADAAFVVCLGVIAWRMGVGALEAAHDNAQTMMLKIPKAWAYWSGAAFLAVTTALGAVQIYARLKLPPR